MSKIFIITWVNDEEAYEGLIKSCTFPAEFIKVGQEATSMAKAYIIGTVTALDRGFERCFDNVLVYCHQDVRILDPDFPEQVTRATDHPGTGFVGPIGNIRLSDMSWWDVGPASCRGEVRVPDNVQAINAKNPQDKNPSWPHLQTREDGKWLSFGVYTGQARQLDGLLMATRHQFTFPNELPGIHFLDAWMCREAERQGFTNRIFETKIEHISVGETKSAEYWLNYGLYKAAFVGVPDPQADQPLAKLNLGCWVHKLPGFLNIDIDARFADPGMVFDACDLSHFADNSVSEIYAGHLLEHFTMKEQDDALIEWKRVLAPGGILTVTAPDTAKALKMFHEGRGDLALLTGAVFGDQDRAEQNHHSLFDEGILVNLLSDYFEDVKIIPHSPYLMAVVEWQTIATCVKK